MVLVATKWDDWSLLSAILLSVASVVNVTGLVLGPEVVSLIPWIALRFIGLSLSDNLTTIIGLVLFTLFFVVVPILSVWRLFRHAYDLDVIDYSAPVKLWDLKQINK